jgi:hypothetical protein
VNIKDEYVGHTTNFIERKRLHKNCCCNSGNEKHNYYVYKVIRENGGWENWSMVEIEKFPCANKNEAEKRERYWIETLQAKLNKLIPTRTPSEYYEDNKGKKLDYQKAYREDNKEKNCLKVKEKFTCSCGGKYTYAHKIHHTKTKQHQEYLNSNLSHKTDNL